LRRERGEERIKGKRGGKEEEGEEKERGLGRGRSVSVFIFYKLTNGYDLHLESSADT